MKGFEKLLSPIEIAPNFVLKNRMIKAPQSSWRWNEDCTADGSDATRVTVRALDQKGNVLPFFFSPLAIRVEGPGLCVGDTLVSTQAGVYAFWVRSSGASGDIRVTVDNPRLGAQSLTIAAKG